jgi:putative SOS response-associated peptidase YedK
MRFEFAADDVVHEPVYNIAPTQQVLTVTSQSERQAEYMRWGLIPFWAKDKKIGYRMINARGETVAEKPSFRTALRKRRCLILADGFYEWQKLGDKQKRPMRIALKSGEPFAFAGLWESWKDPEGETIKSCTIITTEANEYLSPIHHRMPVILPQEQESFWLDKEVEDPLALASVIASYPADKMDAFEVSTLVNNVRNKGPEVMDPVSRLI